MVEESLHNLQNGRFSVIVIHFSAPAEFIVLSHIITDSVFIARTSCFVHLTSRPSRKNCKEGKTKQGKFENKMKIE